MLSIDIQNHRFQVRAAAVFIEGDFVLLHRLDGDDFWALPGGRVEAGEDGASTIVREMAEELGDAVTCGPLLYTVENFFEIAGKAHHEIGLYYRAQLPHDSRVRDTSVEHAGVEGDKALVFAWFPRHALDAITLHPSFLKAALCEEPLAHRHVIQRD
ncbi:MAG: NUDIX domain-containing protein [Pseudomonadota bacterium]